MGNLRSVSNAVSTLGYDVKWVTAPSDLEGATHLILPGVGSFTVAMQHVENQQLIEPIRAYVREGRPLLGICLGMQLLAHEGDEGGPTPGLGLICGGVRRFDPSLVKAVPHVGWNEVRLRAKHPVFQTVKPRADFYYVHSYHFVTDERDDCAGVFEYGGHDYTCVVAKDNIVGVQFHPEKSQASGLRLLEQFCEWDGRC